MLHCTMSRPRRKHPEMLPMLMSLADLTRIQQHWMTMVPGDADDESRVTEVDVFGNNPGALRMLCHVPVGLPAGAPLVVALHGCTQTAAGYDAGAGWSDLADRHGFAVLLPEQRRGNNAHTCFNWFEPGDTSRGAGEAASIHQMVQYMVGAHGVDERRVYVTGLSAGGAMTAVLLATYPDVFAGGAIIAGVPFGVASGVGEAMGAMNRSRALPAEALGDLVRAAGPAGALAARPQVAIWHGETDRTVAPGNALDSAKQWADVHGLHEADGVDDIVDGVPHRVWRDRSGAVRVELFCIPNFGHGVPINPQAAGDEGVGQVMPFMLASSIPSTWHIAQSWGLLHGHAPARAAEAVTRPAAPQQAVRHPHAPGESVAEPEGLVARTFRAFGL